MKHLFFTFVFALLVAACGSTSDIVAGDGGEIDPDNSDPNSEVDGDVTDEGDEQPPAAEPISEPSAAELSGDRIITNSTIVDPQIARPTELFLNPEDDSELWVRFVGGDPNCTAASVTVLTETPEAVQIELLVGITEDALARSCQSGVFGLRVEVPLNESAAGKTLSFDESDVVDRPIQVTPELTTDDFVGLTEAEAAAIADENLIQWRTTRVDASSFGVTQDFNPGRLNFEFDDGVITVVSLG